MALMIIVVYQMQITRSKSIKKTHQSVPEAKVFSLLVNLCLKESFKIEFFALEKLD